MEYQFYSFQVPRLAITRKLKHKQFTNLLKKLNIDLFHTHSFDHTLHVVTTSFSIPGPYRHVNILYFADQHLVAIEHHAETENFFKTTPLNRSFTSLSTPFSITPEGTAEEMIHCIQTKAVTLSKKN